MKRTYLLPAVCMSIIIFIIGCKKADSAPVDETPPFDMVAAKTSIETQGIAFTEALNKGDAMAVSDCYTSDAKLMPPNGEAINGRENIRQAYADWIKTGVPTFSMHTVDVWGNEDQMTAEEEWKFSDTDGKVVSKGKSLELFKMEDGKWKLYRDCYNYDMPPPPSK
jgi:uncharacterized protein (TIGR02246 family)